MSDHQEQSVHPDIVEHVRAAFLILTPDQLSGPLEALVRETASQVSDLVLDAAEGLRSVVSAATLPFQLAVDAVQSRRFDRLLTAERIRSLKLVVPGEPLSKDQEQKAFKSAVAAMNDFSASRDGSEYFRDGVLNHLNQSLGSRIVSDAAGELLIQSLTSTWSTFEHFASRFVTEWINWHPNQAGAVLSAPELKAYFGKQTVGLDVIGEHGFDLSQSMGSVIFRDKRLDNLSVLRAILEELFHSEAIRAALGSDLWMLNQRRHLFVHKRGLVDADYLKRTGDSVPVKTRLAISSKDVERYLYAAQGAILAIAKQARQT